MKTKIRTFRDKVYIDFRGLNVPEDIAIAINNSNIAIITVKKVYYLCINHEISKSKVIHLLQSFVLDDCGYT